MDITLALIIVSVISFWLGGAIIVEKSKQDYFKFKIKNLVEDKRIVILKKKYRLKYHLLSKYGRIISVCEYNINQRTIQKLQITLLTTPNQAKALYLKWKLDQDTELKKIEAQIEGINKKLKDKELLQSNINPGTLQPYSGHNIGTAMYVGTISNYYQQNSYYDPRSQYYATLRNYEKQYEEIKQEVYQPENYDELEEITIPFKEVKILPQNFDYITELLVKPLEEKQKKKGGEKIKKSMPRLWKWVIVFAPVAVLIWDIVLHINNIALFIVQHFGIAPR